MKRITLEGRRVETLIGTSPVLVWGKDNLAYPDAAFLEGASPAAAPITWSGASYSGLRAAAAGYRYTSRVQM